ncbi:hypothetical protein M9H77_11064 [Catharanthus roseus]|uniref:Uncharacterized protein n=1 Tax=Catharanthus roseus TaxID=4058 RepID=A0ACC0BDF4_CATRO|nr:hypothetical protein M9H77_11064 [Catharanthus roseus]
MTTLGSASAVCYRKHDHEYQERNYQKAFKCDGCITQGSGKRYRCDHCGRELHKQCRFPKQKISHEFFKGSSFKFFEEPQTECGNGKCKEHGRCCDVCGKDICGFNYHCEDKGWDLHPCCNNLPKKLCIDETIFEIKKGVSSKCMWCDQKTVSGGSKNIPGWSYVSNCRRYHFHVFCVMELLHGAADKNGNLSLENMNLNQLAKSHGNGKVEGKLWRIAKLILKTILSILMGDATTMLSHVVVDFLVPS